MKNSTTHHIYFLVISICMTFSLPSFKAQITSPKSPQFSNQTQHTEPLPQNRNISYGGNKANSLQQVKNIEKENDGALPYTIKTCTPRNFQFVDINALEYQKNAQPYIQAYKELTNMFANDTSISLKRAVYLVENASLTQKITYQTYLQAIQTKVQHIRYILKKEKLDVNNSDAVHYAIQKLFSDTLYIPLNTNSRKKINPLCYDFKDPFEKKDHTKLLVIKLLLTCKGQCRSLPLLYMILAEEFKIKTYVAYSPEHSFIKFQTTRGTWYNFETTNGRLTTDAFVLGSGFIKAEALKSGIFNQPYTKQQTVANLFVDLANYYQYQFGYDNFQQSCIDQIMKYNPTYIYGKIIQSNYQTALTDLALANECYPNVKDIPSYPHLAKQFEVRNALYDALDNLGFTSMPQEAYQAWLNSLKQNEQKQQSEELQLKFNSQLKH